MSSIQRILFEHHKSMSTLETNFVLSHNGLMACFANIPGKYRGLFAVTDTNYNPTYYIETSSYIHVCGISDSGKYAIFQTANSPNADSSHAYFIDIEKSTIIWSKPISPNWKSITSYHIDDARNVIYEHHDRNDYVVNYDFYGNILDQKSVIVNRINGNDCSHYELNTLAAELIESMLVSGIDNQDLSFVQELLFLVGQDCNMSSYALALTYKNLGELYQNNNRLYEALSCYQEALSLNPKIAVKKRMKELENNLNGGLK